MRIDSKSEVTLLRLLELTGKRSGAINGNIANVNTPGYKRREVKFEAAMREALRNGEPVTQVQAAVVVDAESAARVDGNNVNLEKELALRDQNGVLHDAYLTLLESHYRLLDTAVRSGR